MGVCDHEPSKGCPSRSQRAREHHDIGEVLYFYDMCFGGNGSSLHPIPDEEGAMGWRVSEANLFFPGMGGHGLARAINCAREAKLTTRSTAYVVSSRYQSIRSY